MTITMTDVFVAPNKEATKLEGMGMTFQSSYYDGTAGAETNMQTGKKAMTDAEIAAKKKSEGLIPEMNFKKGGMQYELKGIETINGKDYYVLFCNDGETEMINYYDKTTFLKYKSVSIRKNDGETMEITVIFDDYKEVNGFLFAHKLSQSIGEMSLSGEVKSIEFNGTIDPNMFK